MPLSAYLFTSLIAGFYPLASSTTSVQEKKDTKPIGRFTRTTKTQCPNNCNQEKITQVDALKDEIINRSRETSGPYIFQVDIERAEAKNSISSQKNNIPQNEHNRPKNHFKMNNYSSASATSIYS